MTSVRLADERDAETVARLMIGFRNHLGLDWPSDNAFLAGVEKLLEDRDTDFLLGFVGDEARGVACLRFRLGLWRAGKDCLVEDVYVEEDARGTGLGRALMDAAIARARERGARRMELDTNDGNAPAIALYESLGFVNKGDRYYRFHLDAGKDA
ncbi:MAG TPA: GNAT family N-acetyltransferase [Solirubrobacteraceae bacterium]